MERTTCGSCGAADLAVRLSLGRTPLANEFPADPHQTLPTYPLDLLQCRFCKLAQLGEIVPDDLLWRGEYGYYSSTSGALLEHMAGYARTVLSRYPSQAHEGHVVEIGCNDGILLKHFAAAGCSAIGVDPAKGPAAVAQAAGLDVRVEQFGYDYARQFVQTEGRASLVLANNVAAHVADLDDFLQGVQRLLAPLGVLVMEVQYLPDLIIGNAFDMIYHEHRYFYSLRSLYDALLWRDLRIIDVEFVRTQGGSIRVYAMHAQNRASTQDHRALLRVRNALEAERQAGDVLAGLDFRAQRIGQRLREELHQLRAAGATIAGYGAPAKATTLLHWTRTADYLSWMEDTTPAKHGRFMPGHPTPLPIMSPTEGPYRPNAYLLTAWNYAGHIFAKETEFHRNGGSFVVPLPVPVTL